MHQPSAPAISHALRGWRARAWAWVLFAALVKGLIPHAALASVAMQGDPALIWCAPGAGAIEMAGGMSASAHDCVCASASDGAPSLAVHEQATAGNRHQQALPLQRVAVAERRLLPPPARGPPTL